MTTGGMNIKSNTGNAQIKKKGHTSSAFGSDPNAKAKYGTSVTEQSAK